MTLLEYLLAVVVAFAVAGCGNDPAGSASDAGTDALLACTGGEPDGPPGQPICTQGSCTRVGEQYCSANAREYDCPKDAIVTLPGSCDPPSVSGTIQISCCH